MKYFSLLKMATVLFYCCTLSCNCGKHCSHRHHHHDTVKQASITHQPGRQLISIPAVFTGHSCFKK